MTIDAFCPNCGKRYLGQHDEFLKGEPGCGECAQAGVRPREWYRLRLLCCIVDTTAVSPLPQNTEANQ